MEQLEELEIRIRQGPRDYVYDVELTLPGEESRVGRLDLTKYSDLMLGADEATIAAFGFDLFNRLFSPALADGLLISLARARSLKRRLRLRLAFEGNLNRRVHAVPWEQMYFDDSGGLAPPRPLALESDILLSRSLRGAMPGTPIGRRPIRMLVAISAPSNLAEWEGLVEVDREQEQRDFASRFEPFESAGQLTTTYLASVSEKSLREALSSQPGYDVLLYYGHALHNNRDGSRLVLEDEETGQVKLLAGNTLVLWLKGLGEACPRLVILVACNSAAVSDGYSLGSLAAGLIAHGGVPAVLAMQRLVEVSLARAFTYHLSDQLLRDGVVDQAVTGARRAVYEAGDAGWGTPVLYMGVADGRLFTANAALDYAQHILARPEFARWAWPEYIDVGVVALAPGQDWGLLAVRPEDAPPSLSALEALRRATGLAHSSTETPGAELSNLTLILGPPYSGLTTALRRLTLDLAAQVRRDSRAPLGIFITLAGYEAHLSGSRLEQHIIARAGEASPVLAAALTELFAARSQAAAHGRYILILDGLDRIPDGLRAEATEAIVALADRLPGQQIVVSCTQDLLPAGILSAARALLIQTLGESQIQAYLRGKAADRAQHLMRQIRDNRLLTLASTPILLARIYQRLSANPDASVTRNQLVQEHLDSALAGIPPRYSLGDAARETVAALAWYARWRNQETIPLAAIFNVMAEVRRHRDYSLEELFNLLVNSGILTAVGQHGARFVHTAIHAHSAARALIRLDDFADRLTDIITICGDPQRMPWWEDILYALAGMMPDPQPLFTRLAFAVQVGSSIHALLIARCLEALPPGRDRLLPAPLRQELIDACVLRLRPDREPSAERREQMVTALGRLNDPQVVAELRRVLLQRTRRLSNGEERFEYTNVRIAAARSLRTIMVESLAAAPPAPPDVVAWIGPPGLPQVLGGGYRDEAGLGRPEPPHPLGPDVDTAALLRILASWEAGLDGRDYLISIIDRSPSVTERAVAAFALADLSYPHADLAAGQAPPIILKNKDVEILMGCIARPPHDPAGQLRAGWLDTMWAAADALTLIDPDIVADHLRGELSRPNLNLAESSAQQLAYLAGRVRAVDTVVVDWLIGQLLGSPNADVKSRAIQSLAWLGPTAYQRQLTLIDGRPGPSLQQVIQDVAAWRPIRPTSEGAFIISLKPDEQPTPFYLRRKAIEALAWIGTAETLDDLEREVATWPIELRERWYVAAGAIRRRVSARQHASW